MRAHTRRPGALGQVGPVRGRSEETAIIAPVGLNGTAARARIIAPLGAIVDGDALLDVVWASLAAGVGVTALFGIAILGAVRAVDLSRNGRSAEALALAGVGALALLVVAAAIVFGIVVMTQK